MKAIDVEKARELFTYDPETGAILRKSTNRDISDNAGLANVDVGGFRVNLRRLAWAIHYGQSPQGYVICADRDGHNLRITNLKLATASERGAYNRRPQHNISGFKGVSWASRPKKWAASLAHHGRRKHLGYFHDPADAHEAYMRAAKQVYGEFASDGGDLNADPLQPPAGL